MYVVYWRYIIYYTYKKICLLRIPDLAKPSKGLCSLYVWITVTAEIATPSIPLRYFEKVPQKILKTDTVN